MDIVIRADEEIVGYCVVLIRNAKGYYHHSATVEKTVSFPKVNGEFQNVTEKVVRGFLK